MSPSASPARLGTICRTLAFAAVCLGAVGCLSDTGKRPREVHRWTEAEGVRGAALAFSPDGRLLAVGWGASGDERGQVTVYDVASRQALATRKESGTVRALTFSPDGRLLVAGTVRRPATPNSAWPEERQATGDLVVYAAPGWAEQARAAVKPGGLRAVAIPPDGSRVFATLGGTDDRAADRIRQWALPGLAPGPDVADPDVRGAALALSPDGATLVAADRGGIHLIDVATGRLRQTVAGTYGEIVQLAAPRTGTTVAAVTGNTMPLTLDLTAGTLAEAPGGWAGGGTQSWGLPAAASPDGRHLACAGRHDGGPDYGSVNVWDLGTGARQYWKVANVMYNALAYSPDGTTLAAAGYDKGGLVVLWKAPAP